MASVGIRHVHLLVADHARSIAFYADAFGLGVIGEADEHWTELNAGACNIALHKTPETGNGRDGWTKVVFGSGDVPAEKLPAPRPRRFP